MSTTEIQQWLEILAEIYTYLCTTDERIRSALINTGPRPFTLECRSPWGHVLNDPDTAPHRCLVSDVLIGVRVAIASDTLTACRWLKTKGEAVHDTRHDGDGVRMNAFDLLSANRRFSGTADLAVLGTLVFAGPSRESIDVMVPDCIVPPAGGSVRVDLRHHDSLSLGPALDMANWVPEPNMEKALCPSSLADMLGLQRRHYCEELNPILKKWKSVNNSRCPECDRPIKVNMARHFRLVHTKYVCFWRCPVLSCSLWFTSELNAKDHIEGIHKFQEGHGTSFYECMRQYGIEWFGSRTFFEGRKLTNQAICMDLALARRSGRDYQEPGTRPYTEIL